LNGFCRNRFLSKPVALSSLEAEFTVQTNQHI
jgi:hypothetical protein